MPLKQQKKKITTRDQNPWFIEEVGQQKRVVRRRERIWKRNKEHHQWKAMCEERVKYRRLIKEKKTKILNEKVKHAERDTKELYKILNNNTGIKKENPMPEKKTEQDLADMFANFFIDKISTIRQDLNSTPKYKPTANQVPKLDSFRALGQQEVKNIIKSLSKKTCELDCMPTKLLKEVLDTVLPIITKICI